MIKTKLNTETDIPDFPAPVKFLKLEADPDYVDEEFMYEKYIEFNIKVDSDYINSYLEALETAEWFFANGSQDDKGNFTVDAYSKDTTIKANFNYTVNKNNLAVQFSVPRVAKRYLETIGALLEIPGGGFGFSYIEKYDIYQATLDLNPGGNSIEESLGLILDEFGGKLNGKNGFAISRARSDVETDTDGSTMSEIYASGEIGAKVYLFAIYDASTRAYSIEIDIQDYKAVPSNFIPVIEFLGFTESDFNVEAGEGLESDCAWTQKTYSGKTLDEIIGIYTDMLEADTTFGFECVIATYQVTMSDGAEGRRAIYACDGFKVELYSFSSKIQISIYNYAKPVDTPWGTTARAALAALGYDFEWNSDYKYYNYADLRKLGDGETLASAVNSITQSLLDVEDLNLRILFNSGTSDTREVVSAIYSSEGGIYIKYSTYYGTSDPVLFMKLFTFEDGLDLMAGLAGIVMSAPMSFEKVNENGQNVYSGMGAFNWTTKYNLKDDGKTIMDMNIGTMLTEVTSLRFTQVGSQYVEDADGNYYLGTFNNDRGYVAEIRCYEDIDGNYAGFYKLVVIQPLAN
jgi:hypothetical protein